MWRAMAVAVIALCVVASGAARAQEPNHDVAKPDVKLSKLSPPVYPPLARQAAIWGEVKVALRIGADGNVESVSALEGHPMLVPSAVASAKHSLFECSRCTGPQGLVLTYAFDLIPATCSMDTDELTRQTVSQTDDRITVLAHGLIICDPSVAIEVTRFRSPKCLYLWECGRIRFE